MVDKKLPGTSKNTDAWYEDEEDDVTPPIEDDYIDDGDSGLDDSEESTSLAAIERKYQDQMRQIFPTKIDLPLLTLVSQIDAQIDLRPDFQRRDRWTTVKRSKFIESIIMNVPVPPVFLGEEQYGKYVVLDGRQRLTAAYKFLKNEYPLRGLTIWSELNGQRYDNLKRKGLAATIERRFLPAILLTRESSPEVKYEVFERLNTGGVQATPMEVRNAVFPGPFNKALHDLSRNDTFRRLWGIPVDVPAKVLERNSVFRDMRDLEFVLRFFALGDEGLKGFSYKEVLSEHMSARNKEYKTNPSAQGRDRRLFLNAVENAYRVFGNDAFKRPDQPDPEARRRSAPYSDAIMHAMAAINPERLGDQETCARVRSALHGLVADSQFRAAISTGTNGDAAIRTRIVKARTAALEAVGV